MLSNTKYISYISNILNYWNNFISQSNSFRIHLTIVSNYLEIAFYLYAIFFIILNIVPLDKLFLLIYMRFKAVNFYQ